MSTAIEEACAVSGGKAVSAWVNVLALKLPLYCAGMTMAFFAKELKSIGDNVTADAIATEAKAILLTCQDGRKFLQAFQ